MTEQSQAPANDAPYKGPAAFVVFIILLTLTTIGWCIGWALYPVLEGIRDAQEECRKYGWPTRVSRPKK
jgi:hypothetical protein